MMKELTCGELVSSYKELVFRANLLDPYSKEDMNLQKKVRVIIHEAISFQQYEGGQLGKLKNCNNSSELTLRVAFQIESRIDQLIFESRQPLSPGVQLFLLRLQNLVRRATNQAEYLVFPRTTIH